MYSKNNLSKSIDVTKGQTQDTGPHARDKAKCSGAPHKTCRGTHNIAAAGSNKAQSMQCSIASHCAVQAWLYAQAMQPQPGPHLIHGQAIDLKAPFCVDVKPGEALEVGYPQGREGFVIVHMKPVDSYV